MEELINSLLENRQIMIKDKMYIVKTKTWYTIEEDTTISYVKCELSDNKVLVIIPSDNFICIGKVIEGMKYEKISDDKIKYNNIIFNKTGEGHQFILNIEFGDKEMVEGKCIFEDYEAGNNVISLGILTDKNKRADVYGDIIQEKDIKIKEKT